MGDRRDCKEGYRDKSYEFSHSSRGSAYETPSAAQQSGIYQMTFPFNRQLDIVNLQNQKSPRWFCEVKFKAPTGFPADHFQLDPWFLPVDFTVRSTGVGPISTLQRRPGEQGEVPDWEWLTETFPERYPVKDDITGGSRR